MRILTEFMTGDRHLRFGIAETGDEREKVFEQRLRVYKAEGYYRDPDITRDEDAFDRRAVFFWGSDDAGRALASARLVLGAIDGMLPVETCYRFDEPEAVAHITRDARAEIGRFVAERGKGIHPLVLPLGLFGAIVAYSEAHRYIAGLSFIKRGFHAGLSHLGIRIHPIEHYRITYPSDGPLSPYFYAEGDRYGGVFPVYYLLEEAIPDVAHAWELLNIVPRTTESG